MEKTWAIVERAVNGRETTLDDKTGEVRRITAITIDRIRAFLLVDGGIASYENLGYPLTWGLWEEHFKIKEFYNFAEIKKRNKGK